MNIPREKLITLARTEIDRQVLNGDVISGYLVGSIVEGEPLLGGSADLDLVLIHKRRPAQKREIVALSDQIHLDIFHHPRSLYQRPRRLRTHPWLGPAIAEPLFLYDPQHVFELAHSSVRGQFYRTDFALARSHSLLRRTRDGLRRLPGSSRWLQQYLACLLEAVNALISLEARPACGRRMALIIERGLGQMDHPEIYEMFADLIGTASLEAAQISAWLEDFSRALSAAGRDDGTDLHPSRHRYFLDGFRALIEAGHPHAVLWPLLTIWDLAIRELTEAAEFSEHLAPWISVLESTALMPERMALRQKALQVFLDHVESAVDDWAANHGM